MKRDCNANEPKPEFITLYLYAEIAQQANECIEKKLKQEVMELTACRVALLT